MSASKRTGRRKRAIEYDKRPIDRELLRTYITNAQGGLARMQLPEIAAIVIDEARRNGHPFTATGTPHSWREWTAKAGPASIKLDSARLIAAVALVARQYTEQGGASTRGGTLNVAGVRRIAAGITADEIERETAELIDAVAARRVSPVESPYPHGDPARFGGRLADGEITQVEAGTVELMPASVARWVSATVDRVERWEGGRVKAGWFLRLGTPPDRAQGAAGLVIRRAGPRGEPPTVALVRSFRYPLSWHPDHRWSVEAPRGFSSGSDASETATLRREVLQEAGVDIVGCEMHNLGLVAPDSGKLVDIVQLHLALLPFEVAHGHHRPDDMEALASDDWKWPDDHVSRAPGMTWVPLQVFYRSLLEPVSYVTARGTSRTWQIIDAFTVVAALRARPRLESLLGWTDAASPRSVETR